MVKARTAVSWFTANKVWTIPMATFLAGLLLGAILL